MNQILAWSATIFSILYGVLTAIAGVGQISEGKIQRWAAWGMIVCGLLVTAAGILLIFRNSLVLGILLAGLLGIHGLAIRNGIQMFGKINPSHHLARFIVSAVLVTLTYFGLK